MTRRRQLAAVALSSSALIAALSVAGDTVYTYDALGRLVKVVRPDNVETNYTLDAAGNRTQVTEGTPGPPTPPPPPPGPPPTPTGLQYNQNSQCSFYAQWSASTGATSYTIRDMSGNFQYSVSTTNTTYSFCGAPGYTGNPTDYKPKWVQACNALGCSVKANFP